MPALILPLIDAVTHWPPRGALVGLDLGTKTIGVAVSDPDRKLATGVETIQRKAFKADAARLLAVACALGSIYGFLQGAWPFGLVEAVWAMVALRRWSLRPRHIA